MHRFAFALVALLLAACAPIEPPTTATPAQPTATPRPTATPPPAATRLPTATATPPLADLKALMVRLVNEARAAASVPPVRLGSNQAAQLHAEAALEGCYSSHWDRWGLIPNHRYTLAGGSGHDRENVSGVDYCIMEGDGHKAITSMEAEVEQAFDGWMGSPGHRRTILQADSTVLHIGIANDRFNDRMVQQFSSDYVTYSSRPSIGPGGLLTLAGTTSDATPGVDGFASVTILYDAPPRPLTLGQLTATYSSCKGQKVAYLRKPGRDVVVKTATESPRCVDPYLVAADTRPPGSYEESKEGHAFAKAASDAAPAVTYQYKGIPSERMDYTANSFAVEADLSAILDEYGPGVYRVLLWGTPHHMGEHIALSEQSVFWQAEPPADAPY